MWAMEYNIISHVTAKKNINKFICGIGEKIQLKCDKVLSHIQGCFHSFLKTFGIWYDIVSECETNDKTLYFLQSIGKHLLHHIQVIVWYSLGNKMSMWNNPINTWVKNNLSFLITTAVVLISLRKQFNNN